MDIRPRTHFRVARGLASFLAAGGLIWTALLLRNEELSFDWRLTLPLGIVLFWVLRALNIGSRSVWLGGWALSVLWHIPIFTLALLGSAVSFAYGLHPLLGMGILGTIWASLALMFSVAGFASDFARRPIHDLNA